MIDRPTLLAALAAFQEAGQATARELALARMVRPLQRQIAGVFLQQGDLFLAGLAPFKNIIDANSVATEAARFFRISESIEPDDWAPIWESVTQATAVDFNSYLDRSILSALIMGGGNLFDEINADPARLGISWNLENPRAVEYAAEHAAEQVTKIDETTRSYLNTMIHQATNEGWSYTKLQRAIGSRFVEFATGGENPRSRRVAVFELGDAYEAGNEAAARQMQEAGLVIEKKWATIGDDRVRPTHTDSQAEGWQLMDHIFASGATRSPTDPGCRCVMLYRRATGKRADQVRAQRQAEFDRQARAEIDRQILAELEKIDDPIARIRPPEGRAPRGQGQEYADRRAIASKLQSQLRYKSQAQYKLDRYRGQKNKQWEMQVATARVQELSKAITAAIDVAEGPGDWRLKRDLINGIFQYVSALFPT